MLQYASKCYKIASKCDKIVTKCNKIAAKCDKIAAKCFKLAEISSLFLIPQCVSSRYVLDMLSIAYKSHQDSFKKRIGL